MIAEMEAEETRCSDKKEMSELREVLGKGKVRGAHPTVLTANDLQSVSSWRKVPVPTFDQT
jgi:hypothetical protein